MALVRNNQKSLRSILIDGENLSSSEYEQILTGTEGLEEFCVFYAHEANATLIDELRKHIGTLRKLVIRKGDSFERQVLQHFFSNPMPRLVHIKIDECRGTTTETISNIAHSCPNLEYLSFAWCVYVENDGVTDVIINCKRLRKFNLTGAKGISDGAYRPVLERIARDIREGSITTL